MTPWHRTKIVCTLGPATDAPGVIDGLIGGGMDVARINASHSDHVTHSRRIEQVRRAASEAGQPVAILIDLPGPKFRLGNLPDDCCRLVEGAIVTLVEESRGVEADADDSNGSRLPVRNPELLQALRAGERVFLADGSVELCVEASAKARPGPEVTGVRCEVLIGGVVRSGSGINVPESTLLELVPTDDDRQHLAFALSRQVEWLGVSFVQSADDIHRVRALLPSTGGPLLMAKIEKRKALVNLEEIVEAADGVMVARGDLGVETDLAEIALVQKRIISAANARARPVITATQMLESMVAYEHPTRAEVTDVANAVLDGTDAVMLSAETAIGQFPVAAVKILHRVITATEVGHNKPGKSRDAVWDDRLALNEMQSGSIFGSKETNLGFSACELAVRTGARAVIVFVQSVAAALEVARFRPQVPVVAITGSVALYRSLALAHAIAPLLCDKFTATAEPPSLITKAQAWLLAQGLAQPGDEVVLLTASQMIDGKLDTLQIVDLAS
ncbi:MAG TPA: pyruvate kinase [Nitrosospira sp.]|nr:pyruvate kinase [Nitrosospira sp.]